jgi:predicted TIM-barrel fold metal-dependent hydrolase
MPRSSTPGAESSRQYRHLPKEELHMNTSFIVDMHAHVADPSVPGRIAAKAATNPDIARIFRGIEMLQEEVGYTDGMVVLNPTIDNRIAMMNELGIDMSVVAQLGFAYLLDGIEISSNQIVQAAMAKYPARVLGFAGIDPHRGQAARDELDQLIRRCGFVGARINPNDFGTLELDDRQLMYPFYEKCQELGIPIHVHTGVDPKALLWRNNPVYLDKVAHDFPDLLLFAEHYGFPWAEEAYVMARYRDNVYLTLAWHFNTLVHQSKLLAWLELERMRVYAGLDKIMWGSDYPASPNVAEVLHFLREEHPSNAMLEIGIHDLTDEERAMILGGTAAKVMKLESHKLATGVESGMAEPATATRALKWTPEAEAQLKTIPVFARKMARRAIEKYAREHDITVITPDVMLAAKKKAGV